jgi:hypothetical protein
MPAGNITSEPGASALSWYSQQLLQRCTCQVALIKEEESMDDFFDFD